MTSYHKTSYCMFTMSLKNKHIIYEIPMRTKTIIGITFDERFIVCINTKGELECRKLSPPNRILWSRDVRYADVKLIEIKDGRQIVVINLGMISKFFKDIVTGEENYIGNIQDVLGVFNNDTYLSSHVNVFADGNIWSYSLHSVKGYPIAWDRCCNIGTVKVFPSGRYIMNLDYASDVHIFISDRYTGKDVWNGQIKKFKISKCNVDAEISPTESTMIIYNEFNMCLFCLDSKSVLWNKIKRITPVDRNWVLNAKYSHDGSFILINTMAGVKILNLNGVIIWEKNDCEFAMNDTNTTISECFIIGKEHMYIDGYYDASVMVLYSLRELYEPQIFTKLQAVRTVKELKENNLQVNVEIVKMAENTKYIKFTKYGNIIYQSRDRNLVLCENPLARWSPNAHKFATQTKRERIETFFTLKEIVFPVLPTELMFMICELI